MSESATRTMTNEIKNAILQRLYEIVFKEGHEGFVDIRKFSESNNIDPELAFKVIDEFKEKGFIETECAGGTYEFNSAALIYYEEQKLPDQTLFDYQNKVRKTLLLTLADMQENSPSGEGVYWQEWIQKAGVNDQDFTNNHKIMQRMNLIREESSSEYFITPYGKNTVQDYRKRKKRLEEFERLEKLEGVTVQQRGHKLEDVLGEIIKEEGWEVDKRVRAQGEEIDIIIHKGMDYFFISCKWEADPIQPKELGAVYERALGRKDVKGGIIVSLSGFTDNCVNQAIRKMENCHLIMFGKFDIENIFSNEKIFTSLLEEKYREAMLHGRILIDSKIRDVKPDSK